MMRRVIPVCPRCDTPLFILTLRDVEVDFCDRCRGLWLDQGELATLVNQPTDPLRPVLEQAFGGEPQLDALCPRCDAPLELLRVAGPAGPSVTLDRCPREHGIWFDAGELRQLLALAPAAETAGTVAFLNDMLGSTVKT